MDEVDAQRCWEAEVEKTFHKISGDDKKIQISELSKVLNFKRAFFAERYFSLIDRDGSGEIDWQEFLGGVRRITDQDTSEKLRFLFQIYDVNGDGSLSLDEINQILSSCMAESDLTFTDEQIKELSSVVFSSADVNKDGKIEFDEFKNELLKYPAIISNLSLSPHNWLQSKPPPKKKHLCPKLRHYCSYYYIKNNLKLVIFLLIYMCINIGLFILNAVRYKDSNVAIIIARGMGMCLNFNGAFIIVFMLRNLITWLRETWVSAILPFDDSIFLHKLVGYVLTVQAIVHTICHIINADIVSRTASALSSAEILFTTQLGVGWVAGSAFITGWILDVILLLIVLLSLPVLRKKGFFELFYYSHYLYLGFELVLVLHGPLYWYFLVLPGFGLVVEKIIFIYKLVNKVNKSEIIKANLLSSKVMNLVIKRPYNFNFQNGDYLKILVPLISKQEWHPFTISSAPENKDEIWLHVRTLGNWTSGLYEFFSKGGVNPKKNSVHNIDRLKCMEEEKIGSPLPAIQVFMDGPYGTPTRDVSKAEHAVLIAAGIGVTPFASILQSIVYKYRERFKDTTDGKKRDFLNIKKLDFFWINRHATAFEWFIRLLTQLELEEAKHPEFDRFLDTHLYMTGAKKASDLQGLGLQMALELVHKKEERDMVTGLRTKAQAGRPNWDEVFSRLKSEDKGRVHIFYCGPPTLASILRQYSKKYDFDFSKESF